MLFDNKTNKLVKGINIAFKSSIINGIMKPLFGKKKGLKCLNLFVFLKLISIIQ